MHLETLHYLSRRVVAVLCAFVAVIPAAAGCGGGGDHRADPPGPVPCGTTLAPGCIPPTTASPSPKPATQVKMPSGFIYDVTPLGGVSTSQTEQDHGSAVDAPPGYAYLQVTLEVTNSTSGPEPLADFADSTAAPGQSGPVSIGVPLVDIATFGLSTSDCAAGSGLPSGYCELATRTSSVSGPGVDTVGDVQMAPGSSYTIVDYSTAVHVGSGGLPLDHTSAFAAGTRLIQLLGPSAPPTITVPPGTVKVTIGTEVLDLSRGPVTSINSVTDTNASGGPVLTPDPGRHFLVSTIRVNNPLGVAQDISQVLRLASSATGESPWHFALPTADATAFGQTTGSDGSCDDSLSGPTYQPPVPPTTCTFIAPVATDPAPPPDSLAPGATATFLIYGPSGMGETNGVPGGSNSQVTVYLAVGGGVLNGPAQLFAIPQSQ